jgi:hypothetical protein
MVVDGAVVDLSGPATRIPTTTANCHTIEA